MKIFVFPEISLNVALLRDVELSLLSLFLVADVLEKLKLNDGEFNKTFTAPRRN